MTFIYALVLILAADPQPIFQIISNHQTLQECVNAGESNNIYPSDRIGCLTIGIQKKDI